MKYLCLVYSEEDRLHSMRDSPEDTECQTYADSVHLAHAARADFYRRLGKTREAKPSYEKALQLARQETEIKFLQRRLASL